MQEMMSAIEASSTPAVAMWINWMGIVFLASLVFVWKRKTARFALLAIVLTLPAGILVWKLTGNVHLIGIAHILLWTPLAVIIYLREFCPTGTWPDVAFKDRFKSPYFIWVCLLFITICISLIFDVRDIFLVLSGAK